MKKQLSLEAQIQKILKNYVYDIYAKKFYFDNCTRAIVKLIKEREDKK